MSNLDKITFTHSAIKDYLSYIKKSPNKTPKQLLSILYWVRKARFRSLRPNELAYFNEALKKVHKTLDIDPIWEISITNQRKASVIFNRFLQRMRGISLGFKLDTEMTNETLSEEIDRVFKRFDPKMVSVGSRVLKELIKLGYKF